MFRKTVSRIMLFLLLIGAFSLTVSVKPVRSTWIGGTIYIRADGSIDPPDAPIITYDNITYMLTDNITSSGDGIVVERDNIVIDGADYTLQGIGRSGTGIDLSYRTNVTVRNTQIKNFYYSIYLYYSSNNSISGNKITANNYYGFALFYSSNNIMSGNNIADNYYGGWLISSSNNWFYHNNFIDNSIQVGGIESVNIWDDGYPSGGNYWSDYNGVDYYSGPYQNETVSDGIGDTPYVIDANNRDRYPLMGPAFPPEGFPSERAHEFWIYSRDTPRPQEAIIDPFDPKEGEIQIFAIRYVDNKGVVAVTATCIHYPLFPYRHVQAIVNLRLVSGSPTNGWWAGAWKVHYNTSIEGYQVKFEAWNIEGNYSSVTISILFQYSPPRMYSLTIITTEGGTTNPAPATYIYPEGAVVEVTAIPYSGYTFDHWELNGINVDSANPYTVIIDNNYNLKAFFTSAPPPLTVSIEPLSASILVGQSVTFTSTTTGGRPPYTYQWYLNGTAVSGATSSSWTFTPATSGYYIVRLKVTDSLSNTADSNEATVTVAPPITVSISPTSASILVGQSVTLTSTVTGGYTPYSYQWYLNGNPVSGATSPTWTFTPTTSGIYYVYLKVTDGKGNTAQSETARIAVASVPVGGYSIPIQVHTKTELITLYIALLTILTTTYTTIKRKTKRKQY